MCSVSASRKSTAPVPCAVKSQMKALCLPLPRPVKSPPMDLSLSPRAAEAVLTRARDAQVSGWLLRVAVVAGGCNGLTYELYFVPEAGAEDTVVESGPLRIAGDRGSVPL